MAILVHPTLIVCIGIDEPDLDFITIMPWWISGNIQHVFMINDCKRWQKLRINLKRKQIFSHKRNSRITNVCLSVWSKPSNSTFETLKPFWLVFYLSKSGIDGEMFSSLYFSFIVILCKFLLTKWMSWVGEIQNLPKLIFYKMFSIHVQWVDNK